MKLAKAAVAAIAALAFAVPIVEAQNTSEVSGTVVDRDGNPVEGVVVRFTPFGVSGASYDAKSNKKGRYFAVGLFHPSGDDWEVSIDEGPLVPVSMTVESRTVNRVLLSDVYTKNIPPGGKPGIIRIKPLGTAIVNFTVASAEEVRQQQAAAVAQAAEQAAGASAARRDPWDVALAKVSEGDLEGSLKPFEEAISDEPESAERQRTLARVLYQLRRLPEAEARVRQALTLATGDLEGRMLLYSIQVANGDLEGASATLAEASASAPADPRILRQQAWLATERGRSKEAIAVYERLTAVAPEDSEAWLALADLYAENGQREQSEIAYGKVAELEPDNAPQVFYNIGALIMNRDDRSDADTRRAVNAFRKAIELKPDYLQAHKQLAFALIGSGDRAGAKSELEAYMRLAPNAPDAAQIRALLESLR